MKLQFIETKPQTKKISDTIIKTLSILHYLFGGKICHEVAQILESKINAKEIFIIVHSFLI